MYEDENSGDGVGGDVFKRDDGSGLRAGGDVATKESADAEIKNHAAGQSTGRKQLPSIFYKRNRHG